MWLEPGVNGDGSAHAEGVGEFPAQGNALGYEVIKDEKNTESVHEFNYPCLELVTEFRQPFQG